MEREYQEVVVFVEDCDCWQFHLEWSLRTQDQSVTIIRDFLVNIFSLFPLYFSVGILPADF